MRKAIGMFTALLLLCSTIIAQVRTVTGHVLDDTGKPVPFASVKVKGSKKGIAAGQDGTFSIQVAPGTKLVISSTAYDPIEATVSASGEVEVVLKPQSTALQAIVVTAFGVQRQAKELGYATATVSSKDINVAQPIDAVNGLTGKVSGLQVNTVNNQIFAPTRVTLRGNRSLTGNNQPLTIVDGAVFYGDIGTLNPNDIVDINILKGAGAAAVYGSDASNGVIIITTKKGTKGKPNVSFSTTLQRETADYLPALQTRFGSDGGERYINDFNDLSNNVPYENQSFGPAYRPGAMVPIGRQMADGSYQLVPFVGNPNQKKDFFNKALTTQNNISFSSGDASSQFFVSAQDVNTNGVMPGDKGRRDAFRVGGSKTYGMFTADFSAAYTYKFVTQSANDGTVYDDLLNMPSYVPLGPLKNWQTGLGDPDNYANDYYENPYWYLANNRTNTTTNNTTGNLHLNLHPWSWLNLSYRLAVDDIYSTNNQTGAPLTFSEFTDTSRNVAYSNPDGTGIIISRNEGTKAIATSPIQASYSVSTNNNVLLTSDFLATFDKKVTRDLNLKGILGTSYMDNKIVQSNINAGPLFFPVYDVSSLTGIPSVGSGTFEAKKLGFLGDATLGYKGFAFVHGSYRSDIDSRLSNANRFIPYYDVDGSLVLSDLFHSWFTGKVINFAKLHGSYSLTGNASPLAGGSPYLASGAYVIDPVLNSASGFPFNGLGGYLLSSTIENPNLKPEQIVETEAGFELGFLHSRFNFGATGYITNLTKGIVDAPYPSSTGYSFAYVNAANTRTKGLELDLKGDVIRTRDWDWFVNINYTHTHSDVVSINGADSSLGLSGGNSNAYAVIGHSFPVIEGTDYVRDPHGNVIVNAVTGLPTVNPSPVILGNANPTDVLGITTNLTYKAFTLTVTADYRGGAKIFNNLQPTLDYSGNGVATAATGRQRFVWPNSVIETAQGTYVKNTNVTVDDANFNFWPGSFWYQVNSNYVTSAAAWKIREVALTYNLPQRWMNATHVVQHATFTLSARNLFMFRPKTNRSIDPEFSEDTGNDVGRTGEGQGPPTRIVGATLALQF